MYSLCVITVNNILVSILYSFDKIQHQSQTESRYEFWPDSVTSEMNHITPAVLPASTGHESSLQCAFTLLKNDKYLDLM